jgi:hypothetical protein
VFWITHSLALLEVPLPDGAPEWPEDATLQLACGR